MAHLYNLSYLGGGGQEDCGLKACPGKKLENVSESRVTGDQWLPGDSEITKGEKITFR